MEIGVLGPLEVRLDGRPVDLGSPKQRAVLAVLAVGANRVVSLDRLIDELWGDAPPAAATSTLQSYISHLRRVLDPHRPARVASDVLVTRPPGYVLQVGLGQLDAERFEAAAADGRRLLGEGRPAEARARLTEGLALWRGRAYEEFAAEEFARVEAARLDELRLVAAEDRLQAVLELGDHAKVAAEAEALVAVHPLRERLRELQMVALYRSGRQAEALRAYQEARRLLADELGIDPGPSLRRMEAEILAQSPALDWRPPPAARPAPAPAAAAPPADPLAAVPPPAGRPSAGPAAAGQPFVGRAAELAALDAARAAAGGGRGRAVLVAGEPGIGKTRLVQEAVARAVADGWGAAWGGCLEGGGTPAYWPWVEVLRTLAVTTDPADLAAGLGAGAAEVAQVVPEIKDALGHLEAPAALDADTARLRLFRAVEGLLAQVARRRPLVVVLDDLQWADRLSLQLLAYLAAPLGTVPLLLVGAYRPAETTGDLGDTLAALARHQVAERVDLGGLAVEDVGALLAATTGTDVGGEVAATVVGRTEGNPFFVTEVARLLQSEHSLEPEAAARILPGRVRDVVRRRLARLPEETVSLLALAAVAGREFELSVLEAAAGVGPEQALEQVEAALIAGLVAEDPEVVGRFRFSHDLVRETVADDLTGVRRAHLHARLAGALANRYGDDADHAVELAHHFAAAVAVTGPGPAVAHALRAAEVEADRLAHDQAAAHLDAALALVERLPRGPERDRQELDLLLKVGAVRMVARGYGDVDAGKAMARARAISERMGGKPDLLPVLYGLMAYHLVTAQHVVARSIADEMITVATSTGVPSDLMAAHLAVGVTALHQGDLSAARTHLEAALATPGGYRNVRPLAALPADPEVLGMSFLAWTLWVQGEPGRARKVVEDALELALELDQPFTVCHALLFVSWVAMLDDDLDRAEEYTLRLIDVASRYGFSLYVTMGLVHRGWAQAARGDPDGVAAMREALAAADSAGGRVTHGMSMYLLGRAELRHGQVAEAHRTVGEALAFVAATGQRIYESSLHRLRAEVLLALDPGDYDRAEVALEAALAVARGQGATALAAQAQTALNVLNARRVAARPDQR